jgi:hypothetical protein
MDFHGTKDTLEKTLPPHRPVTFCSSKTKLFFTVSVASSLWLENFGAERRHYNNTSPAEQQTKTARSFNRGHCCLKRKLFLISSLPAWFPPLEPLQREPPAKSAGRRRAPGKAGRLCNVLLPSPKLASFHHCGNNLKSQKNVKCRFDQNPTYETLACEPEQLDKGPVRFPDCFFRLPADGPAAGIGTACLLG